MSDSAVDLNRLREARDAHQRIFDLGGLDYLSSGSSIWQTTKAVLDAPTVWICGDLLAGGRDEGTFDDGQCSICGEYPDVNGCGLRALVPVVKP